MEDYNFSYFPQLREWIIKNQRSKDMLVIGDVQSGKSSYIITYSLYNYINGIPTIVITRNITDDMFQLENNMYNRFDDLKEDPTYNIITSDQLLLKRNGMKRNLGNRIHIVMANSFQLQKLIENYKLFNFVLIIDEYDALCYNSATPTDDALFKEKIKELKKLAIKVIGLTATPYDVLLKSNVMNDDIFIMKHQPYYKGIHNIKFHIIDNMTTVLENNSAIKTRMKQNSDDNMLINVLENKFLPLDAINAINANGESFKHPNIMLARVTYLKEEQEKLCKQFIQRYPQLVTISNNSKGCFIYTSINSKVECQNIQEALQYLKDKDEQVQKYKHILIFAGKLADRGINFKSKDHIWHLTDQFLLSCESETVSKLIQSLRICGNNYDNIDLKVYTYKNIYEKLINGYKFSKELLYRTEKNGDSSNLKNNKYNREKLYTSLNKKIKISNVSLKVTNDSKDGGINMISYNMMIRPNVKVVEPPSEQKIEHKENIDLPITNNTDIPEELKIKLRKWIKSKNLIVSRILYFLYEQNKPVTVEEIKDGIKYEKDVKQLLYTLRNGSCIKSTYGFLWKKDKTLYDINNNIKKYMKTFI